MNDVLEKIEELITAYVERGDSQGIDNLLKAQDMLAGYSYYLAEMAAESKGTYNNNVFSKKITINRQVQSLINANISKAAAQVQAESSKVGEEMIKAELDAEAEAYKLDLLLGQVNRVLSSLQQRISYLKIEKKDFHA